MSSVFLACKRVPLMLLENVAPNEGLYNDAQVKFVGSLYLGDDLQVNMRRHDYASKVPVRDLTLTEPIDTPHSDREQVDQVPRGIVMVRMDGQDVENDARRLNQLVATSGEAVQLVLRTPKHAPHLPEFIVVHMSSYTANGDLNVLGIGEANDLVSIRAVNRGRTSRRAGRDVGKDERTENCKIPGRLRVLISKSSGKHYGLLS